MAHNSTLHFDTFGGRIYKIIECEYEITQLVNDYGRPSGHPSSGAIQITIVSPDDCDMFLHSWMQSATEHKDGQIKFAIVDTGLPAGKTLSFKHAYCIRLSEHFHGQAGKQMHTKLTLSAEEIAFGDNQDVVFKNEY